MREPESFREEVLTHCENCKDAYEDKIDKLEKENMNLQDEISWLQDDNVALVKRADNADARYAELVETVGTRISQAENFEPVVGPDPRD